MERGVSCKRSSALCVVDKGVPSSERLRCRTPSPICLSCGTWDNTPVTHFIRRPSVA